MLVDFQEEAAGGPRGAVAGAIGPPLGAVRTPARRTIIRPWTEFGAR